MKHTQETKVWSSHLFLFQQKIIKRYNIKHSSNSQRQEIELLMQTEQLSKGLNVKHVLY